MEQQLYVVNRLITAGQPTSRVVLNKTADADGGREYGRLIERKGPNLWHFVGLVHSADTGLDRLTEIGGETDEKVFRRTGVDVRHLVARVSRRRKI